MENEPEKSSNHSMFECEIEVKPDDIDELGHVNNVVYLRWVQQVASAHWQSKSQRVITDKYLWVVLRHEIDYLKPALLNDKIKAQTWVSSMDGVKSVRNVKFMANGNDLAVAKTVWCLLDSTSMKPKRIGDDIRNIFS
jgi:acyl-CoA thioester hydrolase